MKIIHLFSASILLFGSSCFAENQISENNSDIQQLKKDIEQIRVEMGVPAIGVTVVDENGPQLIEAFGEADLATHRKADTDTLFRIASISKMFVAVSVLKLVEEGKLHLNDKVHDLAPEIEFDNPWEKTNPILLVHLLEHTTGWDDNHPRAHAHNDPSPVDLKTALAFEPKTRKSRWVPGTRWSYNNIGPTLAAYIVEKVTKQSFEDFVQDNFFNPLSMANATFFNSSKFNKFGATSYHNGQTINYWNQLYRPSGGLNASPKDLANFLYFLIERGEFNQKKVLCNESINRMERPEASLSSIAGIRNTYGLGNDTEGYQGFTFYGHGGFIEGNLSILNYLPEKNVVMF